jgi:hypothetical protein
MMALAQYQGLLKSSTNLMRPKSEDLEIDDEIEWNSAKGTNSNSETIIPVTTEEIEPLTKATLDIVKEEIEDGSIRSLKPKISKESTKLFNENSENESTINENIYYDQTIDSMKTSFFPLDTDTADKMFEKKIQESNKNLIQSANKLFSTEQRVEADSKLIMNTTQSLSKEDLKLMSI